MDRKELRLEILKLTYRLGVQLPAATAIAESRQLEAYCLEPVEAKFEGPLPPEGKLPFTGTLKGRPPGVAKKADNSPFE